MSFISRRREITWVCKTNLLVNYGIQILEQVEVISLRQQLRPRHIKLTFGGRS